MSAFDVSIDSQDVLTLLSHKCVRSSVWTCLHSDKSYNVFITDKEEKYRFNVEQ